MLTADVQLVGLVRGTEIARRARIAIEADAVQIAWPEASPPIAPWQLDLTGIEGINPGATSLTLYLRDHDVIELRGDESLRAVARALIDQACRMPELTRGLRAFGAPGGSPALSAAHDRWFAPLLTARRAIAAVTDPERQVELLDGRLLAHEMRRAVAELAAVQAGADPAEQRALEAALEEEADPLLRALDRLSLAGDAVRGGALDTQFADWRRWVEAARAVFAEADESWSAIVDLLGV